ncbi:PD-(D/E)XK nuclease family protein [Salinarimonas rosea]|uniref:PD-(D/E)XK nuclease family protein n=1 Tax=Salinarimonas rosea TaxID=552063 RepID=UPI0003FE86EE|nr:PD-(D/E)XK nuclease family protein [Salinarimonas rosea]
MPIPRLDVVLGLSLDAGGAPDGCGGATGALGSPVVGPMGLVDILETFCGLSAPTASAVTRIAAWQRALEAAGPGRFWARSIEADAWATARVLLRWRDGLVEAGWTADHDLAPPRLADLAAAERAAQGLPAGLPDRIARLIPEIDAPCVARLGRVRLVDRRAHLPPGLRRLVDRLEALGVVVEEMAFAPAAPAETALGRLQRWLVEGGGVAGAPDGSLTLAACASAPLAAELVGQWVDGAPAGATATLVAEGGDSRLLDHGLAAAGQPRAGRSLRSPRRGTLQVLHLGFAVAWAPFDPHALMQLLTFPDGPIARRAAGRLARALEEAPGRGGEAWREAWKTIEADALADAEGDAAHAARRLERWRAWADPDCADPVAGMPAAQALAICDRAASWAVARHATTQDPLFLATARLADDVRRALVALGRAHYPRTLVARIVDEALDVGEADPAAVAEAAPWRCVAHPGAVWGPVDTLVWWNFVAPGDAAAQSPWTKAEREALEAVGVRPDTPARAAAAAAAAWERAVLCARERILLVAPGLEAHDEDALHPLAHRIAPALKVLGTRARLEEALAAPATHLCGRDLARLPATANAPPSARFLWPTPADFAARLAGRRQSATAFETLAACPLAWALRHVAGLYPGQARAIGDEERLIGNLAHALSVEIFRPGPPPAPDAAAEATQARLDALIDMLAAPLRHPAAAIDLAFARRRLPEAMATLATLLDDNGLTVVATEEPFDTKVEGLPVHGKIDLVAQDARGGIVIVDLKWTRSPKRRREEIEDGRAIQLATYAAVRGGVGARAGYFLLRQRLFATPAGEGLAGYEVAAARTLPETWAAMRETYRLWREAAEGGRLVARGVEGCEAYEPQDLPLVREVECKYCDYRGLCRVRSA